MQGREPQLVNYVRDEGSVLDLLVVTAGGRVAFRGRREATRQSISVLRALGSGGAPVDEAKSTKVPKAPASRCIDASSVQNYIFGQAPKFYFTRVPAYFLTRDGGKYISHP